MAIFVHYWIIPNVFEKVYQTTAKEEKELRPVSSSSSSHLPRGRRGRPPFVCFWMDIKASTNTIPSTAIWNTGHSALWYLWVIPIFKIHGKFSQVFSSSNRWLKTFISKVNYFKKISVHFLELKLAPYVCVCVKLVQPTNNNAAAANCWCLSGQYASHSKLS